jgi:hypothetical protein
MIEYVATEAQAILNVAQRSPAGAGPRRPDRARRMDAKPAQVKPTPDNLARR